MAVGFSSALYRGAAGVVGLGCIVVSVLIVARGTAWSWGGAFALANLVLGAWFLLDFALRGGTGGGKRGGIETNQPHAPTGQRTD